uniref:Putative actin-like protein n=1 Tax=Trypanosoma congolense (strain IL3000) TaxID=1068625 RepID=G0UK57_TRYCI|nr:putative actin-like protein [Trypanosoma congolense IL3000]
MDTTCVIDYGLHSVKHTCISKADKSTSFEFKINETPSQAFDGSDSLDVVMFGKHIADLLSDTYSMDTALTISLLTDMWLPRRKQELLLKCCFECLGAKRVSLVNALSAALFSCGETTGICVDVGYRSVRVVPVVSGLAYTTLAEDIVGVGARSSDAVLRYHLRSATEPMLRALKSSVCFVGEEPAAVPRHLALPDGSTFSVTLSPSACREAGEALLFRAPTVNAPFALQSVYQKALLEIPALDQWAVFGGASGVAGVRRVFGQALTHALTAAPRESPRLLTVKDPTQASVCGGAILSQLSSFKKVCITSEEYAEEGPHHCVRTRAI